MRTGSRVTEHLEVALQLAKGDQAKFLAYLIKMAKDEAERVARAA